MKNAKSNKPMKQKLKTFAVLCAFGAIWARAEPTTPSPEKIAIERVSFYEVPLVCPAAPQIGCGSAAKPLLLELEHNPAVAAAWLNRPGTLMAIVWKEPTQAKERVRVVDPILKQRGMAVKEVAGEAKRRAWSDFESRKNWYRGADVDRLSQEEASVIANRWIGRFREKIVMTDQQAKGLQEAFTVQIKRRLTGQITRDEAIKKMVEIAHQYLDDRSVQVLLENFGGALRPDEQK
jgi:hypothetical protein